MLTSFERMIAFRTLRARREEGFISLVAMFSLVGIALGVATLIVVLSVMNGVREEMIRSIIGLEGHVTVYANARSLNEYESLSKKISAMPGVKSAIPKIEGQVMASYRGRAMGAMVAGFRTEDLHVKSLLMERIDAGDKSAFERGEGIIIGARMAEKMGISIGDSLTLISPEGQATIAGVVPRVKAYPVMATFSIGMFAYDNGLVLMPFNEAQIYFKQENSASLIEVMGQDASSAHQLANDLRQTLGGGYRIYDWQTSNSQILQAVIIQRNVMFLILMLIILVAAFNIISSLMMLVHEKGRAIAILRTMGASRLSIMKIFMACGLSIGLLGTGGGVCLGLLIAVNTEAIQRWLEGLMGHKLFADELYFLSHLPSKIDGSEIRMVALMALALSFLATIYPARRAASLNPAEALRYE